MHEGLIALALVTLAVACRAGRAGDADAMSPTAPSPSASASAPAPRRAASAPCEGEGAHVCAAGGGAVLRCVGGVFVAASGCLGPGGCAETDAGVTCDDTIAEERAPCDTPGQVACSAEGGASLRCEDGGFARTRVCRSPCRVEDAAVLCD